MVNGFGASAKKIYIEIQRERDEETNSDQDRQLSWSSTIVT